MTVPAMPEIYRRLGSQAKARAFLRSLDPGEIEAVLSDWTLWQLPYQKIPPGEWRRWLFRAGRGTGKTFTGARTTHEVVRDPVKMGGGEVGIFGRTYSDCRHTMVEGPSGLLTTAPADFRPTWEPGNGTLTWPNGVRGRCISTDKPESGRGLNLAWLWGDEPAHWADLKTMWWEVIEPALRKGWARALLTTTPIRDPALREIEDAPGTVVTRAATYENVYLPAKVLASLKARYAGTRIGRQELDGEYLPEAENALWSVDCLEANRVQEIPHQDDIRRIVVAVDPAVTANENSDLTGIVVACRTWDDHGYILADRSLKGTPHQWAMAAVACYKRYQADVVVCEVNNGGDLVTENVRGFDPKVNVKAVRASRGKFPRFEPVAAMDEQGRIHHVGVFPEMEDEMCNWDPTLKRKSPDRADARAWAIHELFLQDDDPVGPLRAYC